MILNTVLVYILYNLFVIVFIIFIKTDKFKELFYNDLIIKVNASENCVVDIENYMDYVFSNEITRPYLRIGKIQNYELWLKTFSYSQEDTKALEKILSKASEEAEVFISVVNSPSNNESFLLFIKILSVCIITVFILLLLNRFYLYSKKKTDINKIFPVIFQIIFMFAFIFLLKEFLINHINNINVDVGDFLKEYLKYGIIFLFTDLLLVSLSDVNRKH